MFQASFLDRQNAYATASKERRQRAVQEENHSFNFQPDIGNATEVLEVAKHPSVGETFLERIERMAHADAQKKRAAQRQAETGYYSKFTFEPETNKVELKGREPNIFESLYKNEAGNKARQAALEAAQDKFEAEHTFHPEVQHTANKFSDDQLEKWQLNLADPSAITRKIEQQRLEREHKIEESRRHREFEELRECTFQPNIAKNRRPKESTAPIIVRGLGRHLELKEMARKQEEEAAEREAQVFKLQPTASLSGYTVPQPFKLSGTEPDPRREARQERIKREAWEAEMGECTFQPNTKSMSNRELIHKILNDDLS
eukprot:TRINITY_DN19316_c0_g1_i3.p1 TRINITY_DN19316_c0_g1~~TRINITY_DN19316_c0_g1_i3.p1  ORF type:complete len:316 (+),score=69.05 TRINITY_DN19316_c0_g1_i3:274-1221(+)